MSNTIQKLTAFWNFRRREIIFAIIIFLVASLSFGLGYLASRELYRAPIVIEKCSTEN